MDQNTFTFQRSSGWADLENQRVWFKFELTHWYTWRSEKREVRVGSAIGEGFLEERSEALGRQRGADGKEASQKIGYSTDISRKQWYPSWGRWMRWGC